MTALVKAVKTDVCNGCEIGKGGVCVGGGGGGVGINCAFYFCEKNVIV